MRRGRACSRPLASLDSQAQIADSRLSFAPMRRESATEKTLVVIRNEFSVSLARHSLTDDQCWYMSREWAPCERRMLLDLPPTRQLWQLVYK